MDTRPRTPLISFCTVQLRTLCAAHSLATVYLFTTSGPDPGELLGFWGSMVFRHAPILQTGSGKQQQQHKYVFLKIAGKVVCQECPLCWQTLLDQFNLINSAFIRHYGQYLCSIHLHHISTRLRLHIQDNRIIVDFVVALIKALFYYKATQTRRI